MHSKVEPDANCPLLLLLPSCSFSNSDDKDTSTRILDTLDLPNLVPVKPDLLVGLDQSQIVVRRWDTEPPWPLDPSRGLQGYVRSRYIVAPDQEWWKGTRIVFSNSDG